MPGTGSGSCCSFAPSTRRCLPAYVTSSPAHSRRAKQTLDAVFRGSPVEVRIRSCPEELGPDWWRQEDSLLQVTNEYLKMLYYVLAY